MAVKIKKDDRPFWQRRSFLGENISNGNSIVATVLLLGGGGALYGGWILIAVPLGVAGLLSFVWNEGVAKTTTIIGGWIVAGAASAWLLGMACNALFGMSSIGHFLGLVVGIVGVLVTID